MTPLHDTTAERASPEQDIDYGSLDATAETPEEARPQALWRRIIGGAIQAILALAVLGGAALLALHLVKTGPKAERRPPTREAKLVEVQALEPSQEQVTIDAMGEVIAARRIEVRPRVSGNIEWLSPECIPGGRFAEGSDIARIDSADYDLAVEQAEAEVKRLTAVWEQRQSEVAERESAVEQRRSEVVQCDAALKIELGQQSIAQREYELLDREVREEDRELVLRQPQLATARANCDAARAALAAAEAAKKSAMAMARAAERSKVAAEVALKQAKLDQQRTHLRAPFNAVVERRAIDLGSQVSVGTPVATLVGTDEYWVEVSLPVDQLKWIRIPRSRQEEGSPARIVHESAWGPGAVRKGRVLGLASSLETEGRMARLLVAVEDPLALKEENAGEPALLLGSYVRVEIDGPTLDNVIAIERKHLRDGNHVWIMSPEETLDIRPVDIKYRAREQVLVDGSLRPGERLVVTNLAAPVEGMALRTGSNGDRGPKTQDASGARPKAAEGKEASRE